MAECSLDLKRGGGPAVLFFRGIGRYGCCRLPRVAFGAARSASGAASAGVPRLPEHTMNFKARVSGNAQVEATIRGHVEQRTVSSPSLGTGSTCRGTPSSTVLLEAVPNEPSLAEPERQSDDGPSERFEGPSGSTDARGRLSLLQGRSGTCCRRREARRLPPPGTDAARRRASLDGPR